LENAFAGFIAAMYASARWNKSEVVIAATETSTVTAIRGEDFFLRPFVLLGDVIFARALCLL